MRVDLAYRQDQPNLTQIAAEITQPILPRPAAESAISNVAQPARDLPAATPPQPVAEIPWFHNVIVIEQVKDPIQRLWYAAKTLEHGWSQTVLTVQIETDLYRRHGQAVTNFASKLPPPQSDGAQQALKDPYRFDVLTLGPAR